MFPHHIIDGHWDTALLEQVRREFPSPHCAGWRRYVNGNELKLEGPPHLWGTATVAFFDMLAATPTLTWLQGLFGIDGLHMEPIGGGYHLIPPGGRLAVHTDFNRSPRSGRYRRLNLLVYLNHNWTDPGGCLELWDGDHVVTVAPEFNRTVIFETSDRSWHGHPEPAHRWRRSVAAYFFTDTPPEGFDGDHSTVWRAA